MIKENTNILLVGYSQNYQVGAHLLRAAIELGIPHTFADVNNAFSENRLIQAFYWRFLGKRPQKLSKFSSYVVDLCRVAKFSHIITIGIAPLTSEALEMIGKLGIKRINFLTDDPWNRNHKASWFLNALKNYDRVFSPRTSNLNELKVWGCKWVGHLPFGYASCHFLIGGVFPPESEIDVVFVGGGDKDRYPFAFRLQSIGIKLALFGGGWNAFPDLKKSWKGIGDVDKIRKISGVAKITLCLVRKANRDGHVMRSFEAPASGACMVVEDTPEHREIFGPDGKCVRYFSGLEQMELLVRNLLSNSEERETLRKAVFAKITNGSNRYCDRLSTMLEW